METAAGAGRRKEGCGGLPGLGAGGLPAQARVFGIGALMGWEIV
jgi:hypothetical protein